MKLRTLLVCLGALAVALMLLRSGGPETRPIANERAGSGPIVCFGDSLTEGHGASAQESYPSVLANPLGREVVNRGRAGDTSESALERLGPDVLALEPSVVVITLGGNDILRRLPEEVTVRSMREVFERLVAAGAMVVFVAIDVPLAGGERMKRIRDLAREIGVLYLDSVMAGIFTDRRLMSDRIHPNAAGYRLMAERIHEALEMRL